MAASIKIPTTFTAVDKFSSVVKKMTGGVKNFSKGTSSAFTRFNTKVKKSFNKLGTLSKLALGAGAVGLFKGAIDSANQFEKSMANVSTLVDTNVEDMGKMGDEVLKLSTKIPKPVDELTESLYSIRSAGVDAKNSMGVLENSGKLAVAGLSTTAEATDIATSAFNAFKQDGLKSSEIANILFKTVKAGKTDISQLAVGFGDVAPAAAAANVKLTELSAATAALTLGGMKTASAQTKLKALFDESTRTTGKLAKAYDKLGKGNIANSVQSDGFMKVLQRLKKSVGGNEIAFKNLFSSQEAGAAALTLLGSGNEAYTKTLKGMESGTDSLTEAFDKQSKTGAAAAQLAENNMKALSITVGNLLVPILNKLIEVFVPILQGVAKFIKENETLVAILGGLTAAFVALNFVMSLNPVSLIALGIAALIALVSVIIAKYDEWGASLSLLLGPFGMIINVIQSFRRNWDMVTEAFSNGGILAGLGAIKRVLYDSLLMPIQQLLGLIAKIPGMGDIAGGLSDSIGKFRESLGVNVGTENEVLPSTAQRGAEITKNSVTQNNIAIDVKDKGGNVESVTQNGNNDIPINLSNTQASF